MTQTYIDLEKEFTDEEKIQFFNENWKNIARILDMLYNYKNIPDGTNALDFLATRMERQKVS